jgi:hypothetical protein
MPSIVEVEHEVERTHPSARRAPNAAAGATTRAGRVEQNVEYVAQHPVHRLYLPWRAAV